MKAHQRQSLALALLGAAVLFASAQGCSSSNDNVTPPDVTSGGSNSTAGKSSTTAGNTSTAGKSSGGKGGSTATTGGAPTNDAGAPPATAGAPEGGAGPVPPPACTLPELGKDGCFNCPKDKDVKQWLNRCSDGDCEPFDNKARLLKLKADGSVPDLPI